MGRVLEGMMGGFLGIASGAAVAFGVSAFVITTGLFPRIIQKTGTKEKVKLYENVILFGTMLGCMFSVFSKELTGAAAAGMAGKLMTGGIGLFGGIFTGCLAVALAEVLNVIPVMFRLIRPAGRGEWILFFLACGKIAGSMYYFRDVIF